MSDRSRTALERSANPNAAGEGLYQFKPSTAAEVGSRKRESKLLRP